MVEGLNIPRVLDLSAQEDRVILRDAANSIPPLLALIDDHLEEYLGLFPEPAWRRVYSGGLLAIEGPRQRSHSYDVSFLLQMTRSLRSLRKFPGFEKLLAGFRNPSQVPSTFFEVEVATWCIDRAVSESLEFAPEVTVKSGTKCPDFLWHTELGSLYTECKKGDFFETAINKRANRLRGVLDAAWKQYAGWDPSLRLDVWIEGSAKNRVEDRIRRVVALAFDAVRGGRCEGMVFEDQEVHAVLRERTHSPPEEPESVRTSLIVVGTTPTRIHYENAYLTFTMSVRMHRENAVAGLLRDARTQLPPDRPGAVFIELGGANAAQKRLEQLLGNPSYANTPWVAIWAPGELRTVWRTGQPFDDGLLRPRLT